MIKQLHKKAGLKNQQLKLQLLIELILSKPQQIILNQGLSLSLSSLSAQPA